jgi:hypothetical protein
MIMIYGELELGNNGWSSAATMKQKHDAEAEGNKGEKRLGCLDEQG